MPELSSDPRHRAAEEKCIADVAQYGLHIINVPAGEQSPGFAYTVGLPHSFSHPEIIVFGLRRETMHTLLNDAAELIREGHRFSAGEVTSALLEGYACTFRNVPETQQGAYLGWAQWFNDYGELQVLHMIYPDREGHWPWEKGVSEAFQQLQPVLETAPVPDWA
jgi:hypothetical protein